MGPNEHFVKNNALKVKDHSLVLRKKASGGNQPSINRGKTLPSPVTAPICQTQKI